MMETVKIDIAHNESLHELFSLVARRARRQPIVFVDRNEEYLLAIKEHRPDMEAVDIRCLHEIRDKTFGNTILMEVLENYDDRTGASILQDSWKRLQDGGRLFVIVSNEDVYSHPHQIRTFSRRKLKKMLQPLGRPKMVIEQPFKWLMMYLEKKKGNGQTPNRVKSSRFQQTARLCRGRVLEIGCGVGKLTRVVRDRGLHIVGVDMNASKIEQARRNLTDVTFLQSDVATLALPPRSFDTVLLPEILEHVTEETGNRILDVAWRMLAAGGRLVVSVPNENCIPHPNHIRQFDRLALSNLLNRFGKPGLATDHPFKWLVMYVDKVS